MYVHLHNRAPSVGRATGRFGFSYSSHGSTGRASGNTVRPPLNSAASLISCPDMVPDPLLVLA